MNTRRIISSIVGVSIAILGLIWLQFQWISNAIEVKEANFHKSVDDVVNKSLYLYDKYSTAKKIQNQTQSIRKKNLLLSKFDSINEAFSKKVNSSNQYFKKRQFVYTGDTLSIQGFDSTQFISDGDTTWTVNEYIPSSSVENPAIQKESGISLQVSHNLDKISNISSLINDVFEDFFIFDFGGDFKTERDFPLIDTLLKRNLAAAGITIPYEIGVFHALKNRLVCEKTGLYTKNLVKNGKAYSLNTNDLFRNYEFLLIYFPNEKRYLLMQMGGMLTISIALIIILIFSFYYFIHTIYRQKKLSEMKNDFINNMTHEFKTPISTVALACEALGDKDMPKNEGFYQEYIKIIEEENTRLGGMAESILQTAILDKGELILKKEILDIHSIIEQVVSNQKIHVESRNGNIHTQLNANDHFINGDSVHLTNVIHNLLDNANKYTLTNPQIIIRTENISHGLLISIKDNGIGISKANQKKVFEKLYRVPTGNIHNVKGFGLGLTYVKAIIVQHSGSVSLVSELNMGTTFNIFLPNNHKS